MIKEEPYEDNKCYTSSLTSKDSRRPHPNSFKAHSGSSERETAENGDLKADSRTIGKNHCRLSFYKRMTHRRKLKDSGCMFEVTEMRYDKREK